MCESKLANPPKQYEHRDFGQSETVADRKRVMPDFLRDSLSSTPALLFYYLWNHADDDGEIRLNVSHASRSIGVSRPTIYKWLDILQTISISWWDKPPILEQLEAGTGGYHNASYRLNWKARAPRKSATVNATVNRRETSLETSRSGVHSTLGRHAARDANVAFSNNGQDQQSTSAWMTPEERRRGLLDALYNYRDEILVDGSRWQRWLNEALRRRCHQCGASREASEIIVSAISKRAVGQPMGKVAHLYDALRMAHDVLIPRVEAALPDESAAYRAAHGVLTRYLNKAQLVRDNGFDLSTEAGCESYLSMAERLVNEGGGRCPRCDGMVDADLWEDPWLPYDPYDQWEHPSGCEWCDCVYVASQRLKGAERCPDRRPMPTEDGPVYDLDNGEQRAQYLGVARELSRDKGACPICRKELHPRLFNDDAALAYHNNSLCRCVYVAFAKNSEAIDRRIQREREAREARRDGDSYARQLIRQRSDDKSINDDVDVDYGALTAGLFEPNVDEKPVDELTASEAREAVQKAMKTGDSERVRACRARLREIARGCEK